MMAKHLEEIDHIYDSYKIILSVIPGMGIGDKGKHFLDPNKTEGPENLSLSTGPTLELCTWSGTSTGTSAWSGMSLPVPWDNNWSWNVSKILVKFWFKRRIWEIGIFPSISVHKDVTVISDFSPATWAWETQETQEYLPSSKPACSHSLQWALGKHCILAPARWGTYQRNDFREPQTSSIFPYREKC